LTQRAEFRNVAVEYIAEQLAGIDPVAASWWRMVNRRRYVNICDAFNILMAHGGPSGIDGITEINDLLMDIVIDLVYQHLPTMVNRDDDIHQIIKDAILMVENDTKLTIKLEQWRCVAAVKGTEFAAVGYDETREYTTRFGRPRASSESIRYNAIPRTPFALFTENTFNGSVDNSQVEEIDISEIFHSSIRASYVEGMRSGTHYSQLFSIMVVHALFQTPFVYLGYSFGNPQLRIFCEVEEGMVLENGNFLDNELVREVVAIDVRITACFERTLPGMSYPGPMWIKDNPTPRVLQRLAGQCLSLGQGIDRAQAEKLSEIVEHVIKKIVVYTETSLGQGGLDLPVGDLEFDAAYMPKDDIATWRGLLKALRVKALNLRNDEGPRIQIFVPRIDKTIPVPVPDPLWEEQFAALTAEEQTAYIVAMQGQPFPPHEDNPTGEPWANFPAHGFRKIVPENYILRDENQCFFLTEADWQPAIETQTLVAGENGALEPFLSLEELPPDGKAPWFDDHEDLAYIRPINITLPSVPRPHGLVSDANFGRRPPTAVWGPDKPKRQHYEKEENVTKGLTKSQKRNALRKKARQQKHDKLGLGVFHEAAD
jgi:hypothetical protein